MFKLILKIKIILFKKQNFDKLRQRRGDEKKVGRGGVEEKIFQKLRVCLENF
jgi:hypothetical protein